jgi:drug/metabolite transporter (DMT)-like permease
MDARIGELAALGTALCWTVTALSFEAAGKRIGSLTVNIIRLVIAAALFALYGWLVRGMAIPLDASAYAWTWLGLSGLVGFVIGDLFLFQAFVDIGARVSMLIYSSVPPLTALMARFVLDERLTAQGIVGMALTVAGIAIVVLRRPARAPRPAPVEAALPTQAGRSSPRASAARHPHHIRGALFAFGGALGQAGGLILGRLGAGVTLNPFAATQIRVFAGIIGFALVFTLARRWRTVAGAVRDAGAMRRVSLGAFFGPFLGVSLGLYAAQNTSAGIASTIMALVPVLIIVPSVFVFKERVTVREVFGAVVAVVGVGLLFL